MSKARNQRLKAKRKIRKAAQNLIAQMTPEQRERLEQALKDNNA
jgi:hypothetical protein